MDAELKGKWVAALRSGKYQQGRGKLRTTNDMYCCLGVLCDVAGAEWIEGEFGSYRASFENEATTFYPPRALHELVGLERRGDLTSMNDDDGKSFSEIADFIEANL